MSKRPSTHAAHGAATVHAGGRRPDYVQEA